MPVCIRSDISGWSLTNDLPIFIDHGSLLFKIPDVNNYVNKDLQKKASTFSFQSRSKSYPESVSYF